MDGDNRRMKHHDPSSFATRFGMNRAPRNPRGAAAVDRFRQQQPDSPSSSTRGDDPTTGLSQDATTGRPRVPTYMDYRYTDPTSFQGGALQGEGEMQPYAPDFTRTQQPLREPHRQSHQSFTPYESEMVYNLNQQGPAQGPYEVVPPYPSRQSAALDALSNHFAVPQYFAAGEPTGTGVSAVVSPYLTPQLSSAPYNQPGPIGRAAAAESFPATMADLNPVGPSLAPVEHQHQQQVASESPDLSEAYRKFQRTLRGTFDQTRAGRLVEASRSLLEISEWLVTNARELGFLRDDQLQYSDRLQLWNDFNICWLAFCQRQKDLTLDMVQTGRKPPNTSLLSGDVMESMGKDLIQLCDKLEQHGLVDYQMGIWEEEILSVLGQCLDLIESSPDMLRAHTIGAATATATSRS